MLTVMALEMLKSLKLTDLPLVAEVLGDLRWLNCPLPSSILVPKVAQQMRACDNVDALRALLGAPDDLESGHDSSSELLFTPPEVEVDTDLMTSRTMAALPLPR